jgi:hypothetical protein
MLSNVPAGSSFLASSEPLYLVASGPATVQNALKAALPGVMEEE